MRFRDLGLLVVDEEHRFGVTHKERIKQLKKNVDVLTLTATPIPRTLQLAFTGMRDLSVIDTPPADRLAIRTQVCRASEELMREAILREMRRVFATNTARNLLDELPGGLHVAHDDAGSPLSARNASTRMHRARLRRTAIAGSP